MSSSWSPSKLKAKGIPAIAISRKRPPGFAAHVFETVLIAIMGPEKFSRAVQRHDQVGRSGHQDVAWRCSRRCSSYANPDYLSVGWGDVNDLMINGKAAMMIMGDWTPGVLWSKDFKDFGWQAAPGNEGIYQMLSDSFGLPKNVKNREAAINFLKIVGSKEGQDGFNPRQGLDPGPHRRRHVEVHRLPQVGHGGVEEGQDHPEHRPRRGCRTGLHDRLHERHQRLRHEEGCRSDR